MKFKFKVLNAVIKSKVTAFRQIPEIVLVSDAWNHHVLLLRNYEIEKSFSFSIKVMDLFKKCWQNWCFERNFRTRMSEIGHCETTTANILRCNTFIEKNESFIPFQINSIIMSVQFMLLRIKMSSWMYQTIAFRWVGIFFITLN